MSQSGETNLASEEKVVCFLTTRPRGRHLSAQRHKNNFLSPMRFASIVCLCIFMWVARTVVGADNPLVVEIWPGKGPDESDNIGRERVRMSPASERKQVEVTEPTQLITDVTKPSLTIYRPAKEKDTG